MHLDAESLKQLYEIDQAYEGHVTWITQNGTPRIGILRVPSHVRFLEKVIDNGNKVHQRSEDRADSDRRYLLLVVQHCVGSIFWACVATLRSQSAINCFEDGPQNQGGQWRWHLVYHSSIRFCGRSLGISSRCGGLWCACHYWSSEGRPCRAYYPPPQSIIPADHDTS